MGLAGVIAAGLAALAVAAADDVLVGPGPVSKTVTKGGYRLSLRIAPNAGGLRPNTFDVRLTRGGRAVHGGVTITFAMPQMGMPNRMLRLREVAPGVYRGTSAETITMTGRWQLRYHVAPRDAASVDVVVADRVRL